MIIISMSLGVFARSGALGSGADNTQMAGPSIAEVVSRDIPFTLAL